MREIQSGLLTKQVCYELHSESLTELTTVLTNSPTELSNTNL